MLARLRNLPKKKKEKIQTASFLIPFSIGASLMVFGVLRWPSAPIREEAGRYLDKAGHSFSPEAYHQFMVWEVSLLSAFALLFVSVSVVEWAIGLPFASRKASANKRQDAKKSEYAGEAGVAPIAVVCYFVAFTGLCWFLDLAFPGKHDTQARYRLFFDAGVISGTLSLVCSVVLWRSHRRLAVLGLVACLLWLVWAALPRL